MAILICTWFFSCLLYVYYSPTSAFFSFITILLLPLCHCSICPKFLVPAKPFPSALERCPTSANHFQVALMSDVSQPIPSGITGQNQPAPSKWHWCSMSANHFQVALIPNFSQTLPSDDNANHFQVALIPNIIQPLPSSIDAQCQPTTSKWHWCSLSSNHFLWAQAVNGTRPGLSIIMRRGHWLFTAPFSAAWALTLHSTILCSSENHPLPDAGDGEEDNAGHMTSVIKECMLYIFIKLRMMRRGAGLQSWTSGIKKKGGNFF